LGIVVLMIATASLVSVIFVLVRFTIAALVGRLVRHITHEAGVGGAIEANNS